MASPDLQQLWTEFLTAWPASRVREMTLDQYTNLDKDDAFVYWLEKRTEALGSVWGGSAFKWGVYRRNDKAKRDDGPRGHPGRVARCGRGRSRAPVRGCG